MLETCNSKRHHRHPVRHRHGASGATLEYLKDRRPSFAWLLASRADEGEYHHRGWADVALKDDQGNSIAGC